MLQTRADMESELKNRLMVANNSTTFPATRITELVQQAHLWATGLFFWPSLERGRLTATIANQDYYDYPSDFRTDAISRLYVDGVKYERKSWATFRDYVDGYSDGSGQYVTPDKTNHYFALFGRQYFIFPTPITNGTNNITIWGTIQAPNLTNPTDPTIFSLWQDDGNEAIVKKAFSVAMKRLESMISATEEQAAVGLLTAMWKNVTLEQQRDQQLNHPFFNVPDLFGNPAGVNNVGTFNVDVQG